MRDRNEYLQKQLVQPMKQKQKAMKSPIRVKMLEANIQRRLKDKSSSPEEACEGSGEFHHQILMILESNTRSLKANSIQMSS